MALEAKIATEFATATAERPVIEVRGVSKSFGDHAVLCDVSLTVDKGKTICILGPSGSGKSTLLRCLNWLERPDHGDVYLSGQRIGYRVGGHVAMSSSELAAIRARIGMVFQHFNLWPHLTVLGNLIEAPIYVQRRARDSVIADAERLLAKVGLAEKRETSALDPELVGEVLAVMKDLANEGMTMVVVTHEMGFAREAADEIVFLDHGRVVEVSDPASFFDRPRSERARQFLQRYERA